MERSKKVKVDMNPKRVKDPNEGNKRSPGKFDQKVYMEQESFSSNAIREMARIHAMQVHSINHKYEKDMVEIRKKKKHLDNKCTNYSYLKQLRQAFNEENERREILAFKMEEFARKQANPSPVREATPKPEQPEKNYKPWEKTQQKQQAEPEKPAEIERKESDGFNFTKELESLESSLRLPPIDDKLNTPERVKLEALSKDIMTATLPIERLRRLMPSEEPGSSTRYPIMSKYRRNNVLPDVKKFK